MNHPTEIAGIPVETILALEGLAAGGDETVYLSGSLVEGFGNCGSDIDVFVLGGRAPRGGTQFQKGGYTIAIHHLGRRRVDFEFWEPARVAAIAEALGRIEPGREFVAERLTPAEEIFIHRLRIGVPVDDPSRLASVRRRFDLDRFRSYLVQQAIHRMDGAIEDLSGMLDDQDIDPAIHRARELVGLAIDAYGHHLGNTNPLIKWRVKVLNSLPDGPRTAEVIRNYWQLQFPEGFSERRERGPCLHYVECCLDFAERVTRWIQT